MALTQRAQRTKRRPVVAAIIALVIASPVPSHAQSLVSPGQLQAMIRSGGAAMLGMRIAFGGNLPMQRSATIGLTFGTHWRDVSGPVPVAAYRFLPTVEAGWTLSGETVLKLGSFQIHRSVNGMGAEQAQNDEGTFCSRNLALCLGGFVLGAGLIYLLGDEKGQKEPCLDGNGCPT